MLVEILGGTAVGFTIIFSSFSALVFGCLGRGRQFLPSWCLVKAAAVTGLSGGLPSHPVP